MWYVIGLIWLALIAWVIRSYGKKQQQRGAERNRQFEALLAELKNSRASREAGLAPAPAPQASLAVGEREATRPDYCKKERLLPQAETLLYYVLRTGLPEHEIFANLTLADIIDVEPAVRGYERGQKARTLAQQRLDFVICTKQLEVVAAVVLDKSAMPDRVHTGNPRFAEACLATAGIRVVRIDPAAPPRHHQVRDLIYGARG